MNTQKDDGAKRASKLDTWLRQTLQSGSQPVNKKTVHQSAVNQQEQTKKSKTEKASARRERAETALPARAWEEKSQNHKQQGNNKKKMTGPYGKKPKGQKRQFGHSNRTFQNQKRHTFTPKKGNFKGKLRIIPLGGLNEIGKNCMVLEYGEDIILIDVGLQFPEADLLGVDYVIPDVSYLEDKADRIKGIIFTHGHLDHIGAVPYIIPKLKYPEMYGTQLTMSLVEKQLKEFKIVNQSRINVVTADDTLKLGAFEISFFAVNHSIPDAVGVVVKTPAGNIVHTGDFKFDLTPSGNQKHAEFDKISALAHQNIGALLIDSTNALKPGHSVTEKKIGESLDSIVRDIDGRIIIASFSSQIGRLQQIINIAVKYDRKIIVSGRSLVTNIEIASKIGYLRVPQGLVFDSYKAKRIPEDRTIVLTTGSQGEDVAALSRMSLEEHPKIKIKKGDTVILSSSPIPGNEKAISTVTNNLARLGADIINNDIMDVHASGHGQQEDIKLMMILVKARAIVPIHGEYMMRKASKKLAEFIGYTDEQSIIIENGDVLEMENNEITQKKEKIQNNYILVDGLGVGDISAQVIMDRQTLAENGVVIVMIPIDKKTKMPNGEVGIVSRGFIYMKESEVLINEVSKKAIESYRAFATKNPNAKRSEAKNHVRGAIDRLIHEKIDRQPLILPLVIEK